MNAKSDGSPEMEGWSVSDEGLILRALACARWLSTGDLVNRTGLPGRTIHDTFRKIDFQRWGILSEIVRRKGKQRTWRMRPEIAEGLADFYGVVSAKPDPVESPLAYLGPEARADVERICTAHGVTLHLLRAENRRKHVVLARSEVAQALRKHGVSFEQIGRVLDRHHTSVVNMVYGQKQGESEGEEQ